jgi:hypothetical protein
MSKRIRIAPISCASALALAAALSVGAQETTVTPAAASAASTLGFDLLEASPRG